MHFVKHGNSLKRSGEYLLSDNNVAFMALGCISCCAGAVLPILPTVPFLALQQLLQGSDSNWLINTKVFTK